MSESDVVPRSVWGDIYEVACKSSMLGWLQENGLLLENVRMPYREVWETARLGDVLAHVERQAGYNPASRDLARSYAIHVARRASGSGNTLIREWWKRLPREGVGASIMSVWSPYSLKDRQAELLKRAPREDFYATARDFAGAFGVDSERIEIGKGQPLQSDFMMLVRDADGTDRLLCVEFSLEVPMEPEAMFDREAPHLAEARFVLSRFLNRGAFSTLSASVVGGEGFKLAQGMNEFVSVFSGADKPLVKLSQACSYASLLAGVLPRAENGLILDVLAITGTGYEGASCRVFPEADVNLKLLSALGAIYRDKGDRNQTDEDRGKLLNQTFMSLTKEFPVEMREPMREFLSLPPGTTSGGSSFETEIKNYSQPSGPVGPEAMHELLNLDKSALALLPPDPVDVILPKGEQTSVREAHAKCIEAVMSRLVPGKLTCIALDGHPGVGKTTAVILSVHEAVRDFALNGLPGGVFLIYASNRVVINSKVTAELVEGKGLPPCISLTANSAIIGEAPHWAKARGYDPTTIDSAVIVRHTDGFQPSFPSHGESNILYVSPEEGEELGDRKYGTSGKKGRDLSDSTRNIKANQPPAVLRTLGAAARCAREGNPNAKLLALTFATQGFKATSAGNTVKGLCEGMFRYRANTPMGDRERQSWAKSYPLVVVMVDEIAGDGAGAPFCHAMVEALRREFLSPFANASEAPRVVLVLADASLASPESMSAYLNSGDVVGSRAPSRIFVTPGASALPFRIRSGQLRLGGRNEMHAVPTLHVSANAYPATSLKIGVTLALRSMPRPDNRDGSLIQTDERRVAREAVSEASLELARQVISNSHEACNARQGIFFAQDKGFLRDLKVSLIVHGDAPEDGVAIIDGSVTPRERDRILAPPQREAWKQILMTSAASRGVSLPVAQSIVISVPRFSLAASLMEINQAVFRGRGFYRDAETGKQVLGDDLPRRIEFLVEDTFVRAPQGDENTAEEIMRWARRKLGVANMVLMLLAGVWTRATGSYPLQRGKGKTISVVPVGPVGLEGMGQTLSQHLYALNSELRTIVRDMEKGDLRGQIDTVLDVISALMTDVRVKAPGIGIPSFADEQTAKDWGELVTSPSRPLLAPKGGNPLLPENTKVLGAFALENWSGRATLKETFSVLLSRKNNAEARTRLMGCLRSIQEHPGVKGETRGHCRLVMEMLDRCDRLSHADVEVEADMSTSDVWLAVPLDYPAFLACDADERDTRPRTVSAQEDWHAVMRSVGMMSEGSTPILPALPKYSGKPYSFFRTMGDPLDLERILDSRVLMATPEFNMLNALLASYE